MAIQIKATRWPWQPGGRKAALVAPLNPRGSRFGGGWDYKFGVAVCLGKHSTTVLLELLFGIVTIRWGKL